MSPLLLPKEDGRREQNEVNGVVETEAAALEAEAVGAVRVGPEEDNGVVETGAHVSEVVVVSAAGAGREVGKGTLEISIVAGKPVGGISMGMKGDDSGKRCAGGIEEKSESSSSPPLPPPQSA
ncbi:hypothetical protein ACEPPN_008386 [Leptodophora sp. 'Broadleaf-Isolate-01']